MRAGPPAAFRQSNGCPRQAGPGGSGVIVGDLPGGQARGGVGILGSFTIPSDRLLDGGLKIPGRRPSKYGSRLVDREMEQSVLVNRVRIASVFPATRPLF